MKLAKEVNEMFFSMDYAIINYFSIEVFSKILSISIQGTLLLVGTHTVVRLITWSPDKKHLLVFLVMLSFVLLPLFSQLDAVLVDCVLPGISNNSIRGAIRGSTSDSNQTLFQPPVTHDDRVILSPQKPDNQQLHWAFWVLALWLCGVMIGVLHLAVGEFALWRLLHKATPCPNATYQTLVSRLSRQLGIRRPVKIVASEAVSVPVTCRSLLPYIIFPSAGVLENTSNDLEMVISHELIHIKRWDCLTQFFSRVVCVLFWFNPLVWVAFSQQRILQESACDVEVIHAGISPVAYASMLVHLVRHLHSRVRCVETALVTETSSLEQRIVHILNGHQSSKGGCSKHVIVLASLVGLFCLSFCTPLFSFTDEETNLRILRNTLREKQQYRYEDFPAFLKRKSKGLPIAWPILYGTGQHTLNRANRKSSYSIVWHSPVKGSDSYPHLRKSCADVYSYCSSSYIHYENKGSESDSHVRKADDAPGDYFGVYIYADQRLPVIAQEDGVVVDIRETYQETCRITVAYKHGYSTIYSHLSTQARAATAPPVAVGQQVKKGQMLGYMGAEYNYGGYKIWYMIQHNGVPINPYECLYFWGPRIYFNKIREA
jgi:beta-lactamase regulating signal transducer with metallopeptidase domain